MTLDLTPVGDLAVRIAVGAIETRQLVALAREAEAREEVVAAIPAAESILVLFRDGTDRAVRQPVLESISSLSVAPTEIEVPRSHRIEVSFSDDDAPDLPLLLAHARIDRATFLAALADLSLRVRFLGFRPGFAYLEGLPEAWHLPRRETPRSRVPAGSFAIAGSMAGFYPAASPGGWNLIGRSGARFWDAARETPNLLAPGDGVIIAPVARIDIPERSADATVPRGGEEIARVVRSGTGIAVIRPADPRRYRWGLPAGGAFDPEAAGAANHNVGNEAAAPVLECAVSGPVLRFLAPATLSWCGGDGHLSIGGEAVAESRQFLVERGDELEIGLVDPGARGYLAVRGGFAAPPATALPPMLHRGDVLGAAGSHAGPSRFRSLDRDTPAEIAAIAGPDPIREEWRALLESQSWEMTPRSDRAGVRLTARRKASGIPASLPSAGMLFGTIQWHPDGDLVAMGPDHPVTGGYLQPATIPSYERWKLAQLRPGDRIRWKIV